MAKRQVRRKMTSGHARESMIRNNILKIFLLVKKKVSSG
jgi:hypothetical protein